MKGETMKDDVMSPDHLTDRGRETRMDYTEYHTMIDGTLVYRGPDKDAAIRAWNASTFDRETRPSGEITIATYLGGADGVQVREGWILRVRSNGAVYLNPSA